MQEGETIESIAQKLGVTWRDIALYNWGTDDPDEIQRALLETIGCSKLDPDFPAKTILKPVAGAPAELLVPSPWTAPTTLAAGKVHVIHVRRTLPATAITIRKLSRWFLPGLDECPIEYKLEGSSETADKVALEVYGSHYAKCVDFNHGAGKYSELPDVPVFKQLEGNGAAERTSQAIQAPSGAGKNAGWKGESNAADGLLAVKAGSEPRVINAAFSPYTVHLRYFRSEADKAARLALEPFWPRWEETPSKPSTVSTDEGATIKITWNNAAVANRGVLVVTDRNGRRIHLAELPAAQRAVGAQEHRWDKRYDPGLENSQLKPVYNDDSALPTPLDAPYKYEIVTIVKNLVADSLKVKLEVKNTKRLERGLLQIYDGRDHVVHTAPILISNLSEGKHELAWDGKYTLGAKNSQGGDTLIPEDAPYRVQLQAHTDVDEVNGLALAAMHTEVRLYVHPETRPPHDQGYAPWREKQSLELTLGSLVPGPDPADGTSEWCRLNLAAHGFHPGPVTAGASADAEYKLAMREFKRSVPADGSVAAPSFKRQNLEGSADEAEDAEAKHALKTLRDSDKRPWFGDLARVGACDDHPDLSLPDANRRIGDPSDSLIVWADDRQYYTEGGPAQDESNLPFTTGSPSAVTFGLKNHRGKMEARDDRPTFDAQSIPRPWIPLQVEMQILRANENLSTMLDPPSAERREATRCAIGPLRVDWTFDELPRDLSNIAAMPNYNKSFVRSLSYVSWAIAKFSNEHTRKDTKRKTRYSNCREDCGGSRPTSAASYYSAIFGVGDLNLAPWRSTAVAETESVATVAHDHLVASQAEGTDLFAKRRGGAGVYFHPSRIGGDGYRVRAEVRFEKFPKSGDGVEYDFPNLTVLKERYPVLPHAHSAGLRVWRKSSIRGYLHWGPASGNWGSAFIAAFRRHYLAGHVYFVHEGGLATELDLNDVFNPADAAHQARFQKIITNNVTLASLKTYANVRLRADDLWPWGHRIDLGWPEPLLLTVPASSQAATEWMNDIATSTWRSFRSGLLLAMLQHIEERGFLRGSLLAEFVDTPPCTVREYACDGASAGGPHRFFYLENPAVAPPAGKVGHHEGSPCPTGCHRGAPPSPAKLAPTANLYNFGSLGLAAAGVELGATWLFWKGVAAPTLMNIWAHEIGHHRHLEHASKESYAGADDTHDREHNAVVPAWPPGGYGNAPKAQQWDRRCTMSYSSVNGEVGCFCGRCLLRNRGWKVMSLGFPGPSVKDP